MERRRHSLKCSFLALIGFIHFCKNMVVLTNFAHVRLWWQNLHIYCWTDKFFITECCADKFSCVGLWWQIFVYEFVLDMEKCFFFVWFICLYSLCTFTYKSCSAQHVLSFCCTICFLEATVGSYLAYKVLYHPKMCVHPLRLLSSKMEGG